MSRRYDIENSIATWCAVRELPQEEVVELVQDVLSDAGQVDVDYDDEKAVAHETERVRETVKRIYARTLGYEA